MPTTFQKRQKEMKRQEKQKMKAERRELRKIAHRAESEAIALGLPLEEGIEGEAAVDGEMVMEDGTAAIPAGDAEPQRHNP